MIQLQERAHGVMVPMQKALFPRTSHDYAGFNMNIPDQYRMDQFEREFTEKWITGKEKMPSLITIQIPNDHGASIRPEDGYLLPTVIYGRQRSGSRQDIAFPVEDKILEGYAGNNYRR